MIDLHADPRFAPIDFSAPLPTPELFIVETTSDAADNIESARRLWRESLKLAGTVGEMYLQGRSITLEQLPRCIKFHPSCYHKPTNTRHPALITLLTDAATNEPRAVHRTYLLKDGSGKADVDPNKMMLGPALGAVARLSENDEVTHSLGVSEGLETGLSILTIGWRPIWATLSTANLISFPVLAGIEALTIFADHDKPGIEAANKCAARWIASDGTKEVNIRKPQQHGDDWNDVVRKVAR